MNFSLNFTSISSFTYPKKLIHVTMRSAVVYDAHAGLVPFGLPSIHPEIISIHLSMYFFSPVSFHAFTNGKRYSK